MFTFKKKIFFIILFIILKFYPLYAGFDQNIFITTLDGKMKIWGKCYEALTNLDSKQSIHVPITIDQLKKVLTLFQNLNYLTTLLDKKNSQLKIDFLNREGKKLANLLYDSKMDIIETNKQIKETLLLLKLDLLLSFIEAYHDCVFLYKIIEATKSSSPLKDLNYTFCTLLINKFINKETLASALKNPTITTICYKQPINSPIICELNNSHTIYAYISDKKLTTVNVTDVREKHLKYLTLENKENKNENLPIIRELFLSTESPAQPSKEIHSIAFDDYRENILFLQRQGSPTLEILDVITNKRTIFPPSLLDTENENYSLKKIIKSPQTNLIALCTSSTFQLGKIEDGQFLLIANLTGQDDFKFFTCSPAHLRTFAIISKTSIYIYNNENLIKDPIQKKIPVSKQIIQYNDDWTTNDVLKFISAHPTNKALLAIAFLRKTYVNIYDIEKNNSIQSVYIPARLEDNPQQSIDSIQWHPTISDLFFVKTTDHPSNKIIINKEIHLYLAHCLSNSILTEIHFPNVLSPHTDSQWINMGEKYGIITWALENQVAETIVEFPHYLEVITHNLKSLLLQSIHPS